MGNCQMAVTTPARYFDRSLLSKSFSHLQPRTCQWFARLASALDRRYEANFAAHFRCTVWEAWTSSLPRRLQARVVRTPQTTQLKYRVPPVVIEKPSRPEDRSARCTNQNQEPSIVMMATSCGLPQAHCDRSSETDAKGSANSEFNCIWGCS